MNDEVRTSVYYKMLSERQTTENVGFYAIQHQKTALNFLNI